MPIGQMIDSWLSQRLKTVFSSRITAEIFVDCTVNGLNLAARTLVLSSRLTYP
jgi:hypothetical protein